MSSERGALPILEESVTAIEALGGRANERERMHAAAGRAWLGGDFARAIRLYGDIVVDYPRDLLAVQVAHVGDFFLGQSTLLRDRMAQVLPHWNDACRAMATCSACTRSASRRPRTTRVPRRRAAARWN